MTNSWNKSQKFCVFWLALEKRSMYGISLRYFLFSVSVYMHACMCFCNSFSIVFIMRPHSIRHNYNGFLTQPTMCICFNRLVPYPDEPGTSSSTELSYLPHFFICHVQKVLNVSWIAGPSFHMIKPRPIMHYKEIKMTFRPKFYCNLLSWLVKWKKEKGCKPVPSRKELRNSENGPGSFRKFAILWK